MKRTVWFERIFNLIEDNGLLPGIIERLIGTPARLNDKLSTTEIDNESNFKYEKWSIKKEVGHLIDLEPLWLTRLKQIIDGGQNLISADLKNTKTHETPYDAWDTNHLLTEFKIQRDKLIPLFKNMPEQAMLQTAKHPRLKTPMRLIDLAFFVAEHDDHHLARITELLALRQ